MRRSLDSVGFDFRNITTQRNPTARLGVFVQERAGFNAQPGTHLREKIDLATSERELRPLVRAYLKLLFKCDCGGAF